jgi:uncharacterized integral membrane protein (TIGR00697 family)
VKISKNTLYVFIVGLAATVLIVSNLASTKMFDFFGTGLVMDGGAIIFPLSYILGDAIVEIYGFRRARTIIWMTFTMNLLTVATLFLVGLLPPGDGWNNQGAYEAIFSYLPRIVAGSLIAYVSGQLLNAYVFVKIKQRASSSRQLWIRALGSSLVGDLADTLIFTTIAFAGVISPSQFIGLCIIAYIVKIIGEVVLLPVTYSVVKFMRKITGQDHLDKRLSWKEILKV